MIFSSPGLSPSEWWVWQGCTSSHWPENTPKGTCACMFMHTLMEGRCSTSAATQSMMIPVAMLLRGSSVDPSSSAAMNYLVKVDNQYSENLVTYVCVCVPNVNT